MTLTRKARDQQHFQYFSRLCFGDYYDIVISNPSWKCNTDMSQGQRALDFVLRNQGLIDKTLLFDIELLKIIPNWSILEFNTSYYIEASKISGWFSSALFFRGLWVCEHSLLVWKCFLFYYRDFSETVQAGFISRLMLYC